MYQQRKQQGFTLIELMIVIAIIGILAAFAIPAYQTYIARGQVSEAVVLLEGARTAVEEYVSQTGTFPIILTSLGVIIQGKYVTRVSGATMHSPGGTLTAQMRTASVSKRIQSGRVTLQRTIAGVWSCNKGTGSYALADKYLPVACRGIAVPNP
ncbi:Fimbrial protein EcpC [Gammaproteobacteria bacterium]